MTIFKMKYFYQHKRILDEWCFYIYGKIIFFNTHFNTLQWISAKIYVQNELYTKKIFLNIKRSTGEKPAAHVITIVCSLS